MLRQALFLCWMDFRLMLREREILLWAFVMPLVFFYFIGTVTGGFGGPGDDRDTLAVYVPPDAGFLADQLLGRLEKRDYRIERVESPAALNDFRRRLTIPASFTATVLADKPALIDLVRRGDGMGGDYDDFRINRAVYTMLADLILLAENGTPATAEAFDNLAKRPRMLSVKRESAGRRRTIPSGFQQSVPGTMVFLVLLVLATTGAGLVTERDQGLLRRLASSPMSRGAVVLGKWGARVLLSLVQIAFAMIAGAAFFHIQWGPSYLAVAAVLLAYVALAASLGMLLGNYCRTQGQVIALGIIASNGLAALGGCWWPIEVTPDWCQKIATLLPTGWVMDALHQLLSFGSPPSVVLPHLAALVASAAVAGWWVARRFRFI